MIQLHNGDAKVTLQGLESNSIDGALLDPPAGVSFMGKDWDNDKGGRAQWVAWLSDILSEVYRVMKPGSYALVWALPRTSYWTGMAIEDAGFELVDQFEHFQGQGFPKSLDISKAIDKAMGEEREVVGKHPNPQSTNAHIALGEGWQQSPDITSPSHPLARLFDGYKTQLKPQHEVWWLAMKPRQGTFAENAMTWGVAGLNVDGTRIAHNEQYKKTIRTAPRYSGTSYNQGDVGGIQSSVASPSQSGRYPGNVILSHSPLCVCVGSREINGNGDADRFVGVKKFSNDIYAGDSYTKNMTGGKVNAYADENGKETIPAYHCLAYCVCGHTWIAENLTRCPECESKAVAWSCPVRALDEMSGERKSGGMAGKKYDYGVERDVMVYSKMSNYQTSVLFSDTGGASRFFTTLHPGFTYQTKAPTRERFFLCHTCGDVFEMKERRNEHKGHNIVAHPTQKSLALMQHLVRLIMPPDKNATVLDCMCGTGSTLVAAHMEGYNAIGVELDADYYKIAQYRCDLVCSNDTIVEVEQEATQLELM